MYKQEQPQIEKASRGRGKVAVWAGMIALGSGIAIAYGPSFVEGFKDATFSVDLAEEATTQERGRAEIIAVDLDIEAEPMAGFVSQVEDRRVSLEGQVKTTAMGITLDMSTGTKIVEWSGGVETIYEYDPAKVEAFYDAGDTEAEDRFIVNVPLEAIDAHVGLLPADSYTDVNGKWDWANPFNIGETALGNMQDGLSEIAELPDEVDKVLAKEDRDRVLAVNVARVGAMNDVVSECANELSTESEVYDALKDAIADDAGNAMRELDDATFRNLSVGAMQDMEVVVLIGAEEDKDGKRELEGQDFGFESPYENVLDELNKKDDSYTFATEEQGTFECEIAPDVQKQLNDAGTTADATRGVQ